jgi:hypothetical protein
MISFEMRILKQIHILHIRDFSNIPAADIYAYLQISQVLWYFFFNNTSVYFFGDRISGRPRKKSHSP